jgi:hypothetical protein
MQVSGPWDIVFVVFGMPMLDAGCTQKVTTAIWRGTSSMSGPKVGIWHGISFNFGSDVGVGHGTSFNFGDS